MAKQWGSRPSSFLEFETSYEAYCFDEAVTVWGTFVEGELSKLEHDNARYLEQMRLAKLHELLGLPEKKGRFRDPAGMFGNKKRG